VRGGGSVTKGERDNSVPQGGERILTPGRGEKNRNPVNGCAKKVPISSGGEGIAPWRKDRAFQA